MKWRRSTIRKEEEKATQAVKKHSPHTEKEPLWYSVLSKSTTEDGLLVT
jgi:hypothetical protein